MDEDAFLPIGMCIFAWVFLYWPIARLPPLGYITAEAYSSLNMSCMLQWSLSSHCIHALITHRSISNGWLSKTPKTTRFQLRLFAVLASVFQMGFWMDLNEKWHYWYCTPIRDRGYIARNVILSVTLVPRKLPVTRGFLSQEALWCFLFWWLEQAAE